MYKCNLLIESYEALPLNIKNNMKIKYTIILIILSLNINCSPKVNVIKEVPNKFIGTFYEICDEVLKGTKIADSIVLGKNRFGLYENKLVKKNFKSANKLVEEEYNKKSFEIDYSQSSELGKLTAMLTDYSNSVVKEIRVKNDNEINLFCKPVDSSLDHTNIIQVVVLDDFYHFFHVNLVGYEEEPEFISIGKFTKNKYFSSSN